MWTPRIFPLAPMSSDIRALTGICLALPAVFVAGSFVKAPMLLVAVSVCGLYAVVWFWMRPTRFVVMHESFLIEWPLRSTAISSSTIAGVETLDRAAFRRQFGRGGVRVGAGGLWGAFGLLMTSKETFAMYVSRSDAFVLVRRKDDRPLLLTPDQPERFAAALRETLGPRPPSERQ